MLAEFLAERQIEYIVSSPFDRAVSTIEPFTQRHNLIIHIDDRLRERILSSEEIHNWMEKLRETFEDLDKTLSGGESSRQAMSRGNSVITELLKRPESRIAVVTHGNLMSLILKCFDDRYGFEEWRTLTNPDVYEVVIHKDEIKPNINRIWK